MDEGAMQFLEWEINEIHTVEISGTRQVEIVGITRGEFARTMYFIRSVVTKSPTSMQHLSIYNYQMVLK